MVAAVAEPSVIRRPAPWNLVLGTGGLVLAAAHLASLPLAAHSLLVSALLVVMTALCIKCAWCLLRGGEALGLMLMSAGMGMVHAAMALGLPWLAGHHEHSLTVHSAGHGALMLILALAEFVMMYAAAALCHIQRKRASLGS